MMKNMMMKNMMMKSMIKKEVEKTDDAFLIQEYNREGVLLKLFIFHVKHVIH